MASSSSSPFSFEPLSSSSVPQHDIFLSHSDAQKPFVTALYQQLRTRYSTFFDITPRSLPRGEDFPSHIFHAARTCRLAVVVLSHEYLLSKWPMLELCAFVEAKPPPKIMPLFFTLLPKDLQQKQNQEVWRRTWAEFAKEDSRIDVSKWDSALKELGKRNGIPLDLSNGQSACIDKVLSCICENLLPSMRHDFFGFPGIHRMSQDILAKFDKLDINGSKVCVLGMYGHPGSGKSTLCRYLHDHLFQRFAGKVLYLELPTNADNENLLVKSKELLNQLTNFKNKMDLSTVSHLGQVCHLLRGTDFSNSRVFLVVDNISSEKSQNFVITILGLGLAVGSKVLLVARSRSILCRPLLQEDGPHPSSRYDYGCMSVLSLNKEEALRVLLQSRGGVGLADASALEAALTPRHRQIMEEVLSMSSFGKKKEYLPLVLTIMGEQLRQHEPDLEDWKRMMTSFWTGVGMCKEKALKQLVLQNFKALPQKLQTLFLDAALFIIPLSYLDGESNMVGEAFLHLSLIQGRKREEIECEMQELQKHGFLTIWEHKYSTPTISVHDVYLEFAASIEEASQYYWSSGLRWSNVERNQSIEVARNKELGLRTVVLELEEGCEELKFFPQLSRVKAMVLRNCKSLNILWGFANLIRLASLEIRNCPSLKWVEPPATGCEWPYLQRVRWINQEEKGHGAERAQQQDRRDTASVSMKLRLWKAIREFVLRMGMPRRGVMEVAGLLLQMRGLEVLRLENADIGQGMDLNGCLPQLRVLEVASEHMKQFCVCNLPNLEELVYSGDVHSYRHRSAMKSGHSWQHGSGLFHEGSRSRVVIGRDFLAGCPKLQRVCVMDASLEDELQGITIPSSHLKELWVNSLRNLSSLPALTAAPESLEWLTLWDCPKVKSANFGRTYGSLGALYLGNCSNVTEVTGLDGLPNLHTLSIEGCTSLKTVSGLGGLVSLREFKVRGDCPNLQRCLLHDLEGLTEVEWIEYDGPWLMDAGFNVRGLANLGFLELGGTITTGTLVGVESLNRLEILHLECRKSEPFSSSGSSATGVTGSDGTLLVDLATLLGVAEPSDLSSLGSLEVMHLEGLRMLASLKGIEFLPSLTCLRLEELPNLTCLQGIEALGGLRQLSLRRCASVEELPSLSTLVKLSQLTCDDCIKLSSVEGCGRLQNLHYVSFQRCESLARFPLLDLEYWTGILSLEIRGSKFASVEAAMEWAEDKEAPQLLRTTSMAALNWELSRSSTDHYRVWRSTRPGECSGNVGVQEENACEMLLDKVLLKVAQRCDNGEDDGEESFPSQLSKLSLLAEKYLDFQDRQNSFSSRFYEDLFFNNNSRIAQMYHESMPSMQLEEALRCFAQLPKQRLVAHCRSDPNFPFFLLHLLNRACTSTSFP